MIVTTTVNRFALVLALVLAATIVWIGVRDSEPLLIVLGPALLLISASIRAGAGDVPARGRASAQRLEPLPAPSDEVSSMILAGKKIAAIKQYRNETGAGLRESKDAVEALEQRIRLTDG